MSQPISVQDTLTFSMFEIFQQISANKKFPRRPKKNTEILDNRYTDVVPSHREV